MKLFLSSLGGVFPLEDVYASDTIENLKSKISTMSGVDVDDLSLLFDGEMMQDGKKLTHYQIKDLQTIRVEVKARFGFQFNDLQNKVSGYATPATLTELNKHTFVFDGLNFVGKCEVQACPIRL